jgi:hypothetical protein
MRWPSFSHPARILRKRGQPRKLSEDPCCAIATSWGSKTMDSRQLDELARCLSTPGSRRFALAAILGGSLSAFDNANSRAKKGKGKKRKKHKRHSGEGGPCQGVPDDTPCEGAGKCLSGVCNQPPTCRTQSDGICGGGEACCNGSTCLVLATCGPGLAGAPCKIATDCVSGLACVGYRCR